MHTPTLPSAVLGPTAQRTATGAGWWRDAVIYQVYVRSFRDSDGDGIGDLGGVREQLPYLKRLGVDGIWLNPFYPSPQHDHGYDITDHRAVDPVYGDLAEFAQLVSACHRLGLKLVVDAVPNHCSIEHPWFRAALAAGPGSPERARFHFAEGRGERGELPPNNWRAMFGGPAWSRVADGQWYLHLFTPQQPDFNWRHPAVAEEFEQVLRFWLDQGVDGFRIDVAAGLFKHPELPDSPDPEADERARDSVNPLAWNQPQVHEIWRSWRAICEEYTARDGQDRLLVGEVSVPTPADQAGYLRPDELHQAFFFHLLHAPWDAKQFCRAIDEGLRDIAATGSTVTWVLNNHDQIRTASRFAGPDPVSGPARAAAAALLMLALPGAAYVYQGEELGLPEVTDLPDELITDPIFHRTGSRIGIRDGCRVPLPWSGGQAPYGFSREGAAAPWLPQPAHFAAHTAERVLADTGSIWHLYRDALQLRRALPQLGEGTLTRLHTPPGLLAFERGEGFVCAVNFNDGPVPAPCPGTPLLASGPCPPGILPAGTAAWWISL
ncbi:glycoside hydrolase family 13 protein [Kitasatospora azatica]|uniref:glycoside hydrolase family 13 protein n=1 Tax=Kitasatospora azatica TaxID=58347 RepID=UPI000563B012|nr:glycoside hydrolase family 13 protein [Kitasatospora azatica]